MKKRLLLFVLAFMCLQAMVNANAVSVQTAQTIAVNFFNSIGSGRGATASLSYTQTESDGVVEFYVFSMAPQNGFVIIAANDNVQPVIAYSNETYFNPNGTRNGVSDWIKST